MNKAVFLDRDGVLNKELGAYVTRLEDFEVLDHVPQNLHRLQDAGYLLIVITNQGGIAKQLYTEETLAQMHTHLKEVLLEHGVKLDAIYHCPHHPDFGECLCRKPKSLLVEKAIGKFCIDPISSWFVGDKQRDMQAAEGAGVRGLLIDANANWSGEVEQILHSSSPS